MTDIDPKKLLRGGYELDRLPDEPYLESPPPHADTHILSKEEILREPIVDIKGNRNPPAWPDEAPFVVCLTHDVDHVSANSPRHHVRRGLLRGIERLATRYDAGNTVPRSGVFESLKGFGGGFVRAARAASARGPDPYHRWEEWLDVEESVGARSTFFVLPERTSRRHVTDAEYRYSDPISFEGKRRTLSQVLRTVNDRGWEIGLHGAWYTFDDAVEMLFQKEQLETAIDSKVVSVRQHWLHYDIRSTPIAQVEAGLRYDSTLGPVGDVGFRFGTSYPWHIRDPEKGDPLSITEIPLVVQDTALFDKKYLALNETEAVECVLQLADRVEEFGGVLTLNWHNSVEQQRFSAYRTILSILEERDPWFATVAEVGRWWNEAIETDRL